MLPSYRSFELPGFKISMEKVAPQAHSELSAENAEGRTGHEKAII